MASYNIEINYKRSGGYDVLYPKTIGNNIANLKVGIEMRHSYYTGTGSGKATFTLRGSYIFGFITQFMSDSLGENLPFALPLFIFSGNSQNLQSVCAGGDKFWIKSLEGYIVAINQISSSDGNYTYELEARTGTAGVYVEEDGLTYEALGFNTSGTKYYVDYVVNQINS